MVSVGAGAGRISRGLEFIQHFTGIFCVELYRRNTATSKSCEVIFGAVRRVALPEFDCL